jgi:hypothetical protein
LLRELRPARAVEVLKDAPLELDRTLPGWLR